MRRSTRPETVELNLCPVHSRAGKRAIFVLLLVVASVLLLAGVASAQVIPEAQMASLVGRAEQSGSVVSAERCADDGS
jgi:hypothetical protein